MNLMSPGRPRFRSGRRQALQRWLPALKFAPAIKSAPATFAPALTFSFVVSVALVVTFGLGCGGSMNVAEAAIASWQSPETPAAPPAAPQENEPTTPPATGAPATSSGAAESQPKQDPVPTEPAAAGDETAPKIGPMVQQYLDKRKELRNLDDQINRQLTSVSPTAAADYQEMVKQLNELRARKAALAGEILEASVEAYLEAPNKYREVNDDLTKYMRSLLGEQGSGTKFDPEKARASAERLISSGTKNLNIYFYGSYAAFCLNEFEVARTWLQKLLDAGAKPEQTILKQIEDASGKWGRELKLREADTASQVPQVAITTDLGELVVELYENEAPNTVANFIYLVEKKYYDGSFFYLSQPGRLVMAGCTKGDGRTNAGYYVPDEIDRPEIRHHFSGVLAMAADEPNTGSARFSILQQPTPGGDGKLTVFGRVTSGMDVIYRVPAIKPTDIRLGAQPVKIISMRVLRKQDHPYEPKTLPLPEEDKSGK